MQDYTGMFEKVAGADFELYKLAKSNSEMLWEQLNSQGKRDIDANARRASMKLDRVNLRAIRSKVDPRLMRAAQGLAPRRAELGREIAWGAEDVMRRKGFGATKASPTFKNPAFAAANASHVPSMSGIFSNAVKRKLFK